MKKRSIYNRVANLDIVSSIRISRSNHYKFSAARSLPSKSTWRSGGKVTN
jgi:hypothetical protein